MRLSTHTDPGPAQGGCSSVTVRALEISIAADKALVAQVRHSVRATLASWGAGAIEDDMAMVATELASNALKHAGGQATVRLRLVEGQALLEVDDSSMQRPVALRIGAEVEAGRGLFLVQALAAEWGWSYRQGGGKTVWALLPVPAEGAA